MKRNCTASLRQSHGSHTLAPATSSGRFRARFLLVILSLGAALCVHWGMGKSERVLAAAQSNTIIALTANNQILQFNSAAPGTIISTLPVKGIQAGDTLVGIDFRPAKGQLYGMGVNGSTGRLYTINAVTGTATAVGTGFALPQSAGASAGKDYGFDFNPTVDRIRVMADSRDNFRLHPDTGAVAGVDFILSPGAVVVGAAYDRNFAGSKVTTLYGIDANNDQLVSVGGIDSSPSPNGGVVRSIGPLGVNTTNELGFDIANDAATSAYASLTVDGKPTFYTIDLMTGAATLVGTIGNGGVAITDISVAPAGALLPTSLAYTIWAIDSANKLLSFSADKPGKFASARPVTGLQAGVKLAGIDFRPATGQLYALGVNGSTGRLYTINPATAVATALGTGFALPQSEGASAGKDYGFDFNPTVDRIRVTADSRDNFRLHPDTGAVAGVDFILSQGAAVVGAAYDRNFAGSKVTTLYGIDANNDQLVSVGGIDSSPTPNGGVVRTIGPLGVNTSAAVGFDITVGDEGMAFATLTVDNKVGLYTIYLPSGTASLVGALGATAPIVDIAVAPSATTQSQSRLQ
ncbi:MAG TPA: DUF4394 domain-containing protein [Blastocatellia bacterium]|nr:DUF4394 domain-containing protein [Blastocatellia bacterium]